MITRSTQVPLCWVNQGVSRAFVLICSGAFSFLDVLVFTDCPCSSACGLFVHLQSQQLSPVMLPPLLQSNLSLLLLLFLPPTFKVPCDYIRASQVAQWQRICLPMQEMWDQFLGWEDPLEKEMVTDPRSLCWEIPWTERPGRLRSMGSQRVGHNSVTK